MNTPLFSLQCSRLPAEKSSVCTGLGTCGPVDFHACAVIYIPKRNKLIPKRNKLTFLSVTFDIPKRDGHVCTYVHYGENTSRIMLLRTNALSNNVQWELHETIPSDGSPSCLHTTLASSKSQESSHTVPHVLP